MAAARVLCCNLESFVYRCVACAASIQHDVLRTSVLDDLDFGLACMDAFPNLACDT